MSNANSLAESILCWRKNSWATYLGNDLSWCGLGACLVKKVIYIYIYVYVYVYTYIYIYIYETNAAWTSLWRQDRCLVRPVGKELMNLVLKNFRVWANVGRWYFCVLCSCDGLWQREVWFRLRKATNSQGREAQVAHVRESLLKCSPYLTSQIMITMAPVETSQTFPQLWDVSTL